jgi:hypothetical protein
MKKGYLYRSFDVFNSPVGGCDELSIRLGGGKQGMHIEFTTEISWIIYS